MRRHLVTPLALAVALAGCGDSPAPASPDLVDASEPRSGRSVADAAPIAPGCHFRFHAQLKPVEPGATRPGSAPAGQIRIQLKGDEEGGGEARYRGGIDVPTLPTEEWSRMVAEILERIPSNTPEWSDTQKNDGAGIVGSRLRFGGEGPVAPALGAALARATSDFFVRVTVETAAGPASFEGLLEPERGRSGEARGEDIEACFGV